MTERLGCCVPFCRRTTKRTEWDEWLCGDHWRMIPKDKRRVYGRIVRRWRRYHKKSDVPRGWRIWNRLKSIAIERAAGVS